jgi:lipopolysaccharide export LptBFGC system permease protein LptF
MNRRFSHYLIREIVPLYAAGLTALLILLLGSFLILGVLAEAVSRGVGPGLVAKFLLFSIPTAAAMGCRWRSFSPRF